MALKKKTRHPFASLLAASITLLAIASFSIFGLKSLLAALPTSKSVAVAQTLAPTPDSPASQSDSDKTLKPPIPTATPANKPAADQQLSTAPQNPTGQAGIPILMYHYVGNNPNPSDRQRDILSITPVKLDEQFQWLSQNGFTPITLDTLYGFFAGKEKINKPVVLTFDDGYVDFYINAFPILQKYHFRAVSFLPTGLIDTTYYLTWSQIKVMQNSGLVSFQAHTITHPSLTTLTYPQIQNELSESKQTLQQQLGATVNFIAYPYGASNPTVWQLAQQAGFVGGVGTWTGKALGPSINMPRIRITGNLSLPEFASKLAGN